MNIGLPLHITVKLCPPQSEKDPSVEAKAKRLWKGSWYLSLTKVTPPPAMANPAVVTKRKSLLSSPQRIQFFYLLSRFYPFFNYFIII